MTLHTPDSDSFATYLRKVKWSLPGLLWTWHKEPITSTSSWLYCLSSLTALQDNTAIDIANNFTPDVKYGSTKLSHMAISQLKFHLLNQSQIYEQLLHLELTLARSLHIALNTEPTDRVKICFAQQYHASDANKWQCIKSNSLFDICSQKILNNSRFP